MKQDVLDSALQDVKIIGDVTSHKATIDAEDMAWILQILSTNLYSNPIGSLIREYSSNAWDANVEAGKGDKPIQTGFIFEPDGNVFWYVTDVGPGLTPERIENVYRKFGKSTKRDSNEAIGMMGLGKFSGLSYSESIYIITRVDGIEYTYIMHKADGLPQIDLLMDIPSDLPQGTTIKIPIRRGDVATFKEEMMNQLKFFENVYFHSIGNSSSYYVPLSNNYTLTKGKTFVHSNMNNFDICFKLGPVAYPIDHDKIPEAVSIINFKNIGISFDIGELAITPNRESLLYNKKTIENIRKKLDEFKKELAELYSATVKEYVNIDDFFLAKTNASVNINGTRLSIRNMLNEMNLPIQEPYLKGMDFKFYGSNKAELFYDYSFTKAYHPSISNKGKVTGSYYSAPISVYDTFDLDILRKVDFDPEKSSIGTPNPIFFFDGKDKFEMESLKHIYLHEEKKMHSFIILEKDKETSLFKTHPTSRTNSYGNFNYTSDARKTSYYKILGLHNYPRNQWRDIITKFQTWQKNIVEPRFPKYNDVVVSEEWKKLRRENGRTNYHLLRKNQGKILLKKARTGGTYSSNCVFDNYEVKISDLALQKNHFYIYGSNDDKEILSKAYSIKHYLYNKSNTSIRGKSRNVDKYFNIVLTSERNLKVLKDLPNFINITKFMEGETKLFAKIASRYKLYHKFKDSPLYYCKNLIKELRKEDCDIINLVESEIYDGANFFIRRNGVEETFYKEMLIVAEKTNNLDFYIEDLSNKFEETLKKYEWVKHLRPTYEKIYQHSTGTYTEDTIKFAVEIAKSKNIKLDTKWYVPPPETKIEEEPVEIIPNELDEENQLIEIEETQSENDDLITI